MSSDTIARALALGAATEARSAPTIGTFSTARVGGSVIPLRALAVRTSSYSSSFGLDSGGAQYIRDDTLVTSIYAAANPLSTFRLPDENGTLHGYRLDPSQTLSLEMFGGKADAVIAGSTFTGTDNSPAMDAALDFIQIGTTGVFRPGIRLRLGYGVYGFSRPWKIKRNVLIEGVGGAGAGNATLATQCLFPANVSALYCFTSGTLDPDTGLTIATDASGFHIRNVMLRGLGGTDRTKHAFIARCRFVAENLFITSFAGDGYNIKSNDTTLGAGNVNNWRIYGGRVTLCQNGIYTEGADANAGYAHGVDNSANRQCGILNRAFLANTFVACHENGNGSLGQVGYSDGNRYRTIATVAGFDDPSIYRTGTPDTNPNWEFVQVGGVNSIYQAWTSTGEYLACGQKVSTGNSSPTLFLGGYTEPGYPASYIVSPARIDGGSNSAGVKGTGAFFANGTIANLLSLGMTGLIISSIGTTGVGIGANWHNTGSLSASRGVSVALSAGYEADLITPHYLARLFATGTGSSVAAQGRIGFEIYDQPTLSWIRTLVVEGSTKTMHISADNTWSLGTSSFRWSQVYAGTSTINTSDERAKTNILPIDDALLDAWGDVEWRQFQMVDAVARKGDAARIHTGVVAQQVRDVLAAKGFDGTHYGLLCFDAWDDQWEEWEDEYEDQAAEYLLDEHGGFARDDSGEPIIAKPAGRLLVKEAGKHLVKPAGDLWGIRYDEAFAIEAAYQRRRMDRIEARVTSTGPAGAGVSA